jgi:hypothetical protein
MELTASEKLVWDASPSGGQNQFINLAGEATPNISDQLMRHVYFDLKRVPLSIDDIRSSATSVVTLEVPEFE